MRFIDEFCNLASKAGGSHQTRDNRINIASRMADDLKLLNIQIRKVAHLKEKHIVQYVERRLANGIEVRTICNETSAIRVALRKAGRNKLANSINISNKSLGISGGSRLGKHRAMPSDRFNMLLVDLESIDKGVAACALLAIHLGLRAEEAVQSNKSLKTWEKFLLQGKPIWIIYGAKNGRAREVHVVDTELALSAIRNALSLTKTQKGKLVDKPSLKQAMARYQYCMRVCGAIGEFSGHSLRCAFAVKRVDKYLEDGFTKEEAFALTSMDLGHGDGRGKYVELVYYRK